MHVWSSSASSQARYPIPRAINRYFPALQPFRRKGTCKPERRLRPGPPHRATPTAAKRRTVTSAICGHLDWTKFKTPEEGPGRIPQRHRQRQVFSNPNSLAGVLPCPGAGVDVTSPTRPSPTCKCTYLPGPSLPHRDSLRSRARHLELKEHLRPQTRRGGGRIFRAGSRRETVPAREGCLYRLAVL